MSENRRAYSYPAMKATVDKCNDLACMMQMREKLVQNEKKYSCYKPDMTLKSEKKRLLAFEWSDMWDGFLTSLGTILFLGLFFIISLIIPVILKLNDAVGFFVVLIEFAILFGVCYYYFVYKEAEKNIAYNSKLQEGYKDLSSIRYGIKELTDKINECEEELLNRSKYLLTREYWPVANQLLYFIDSGRADTLKEALNLYEDLRHKQELTRIMNEVLKAANETAQINLKTHNEVIRARLAAESGAESARRAEQLSWFNYLS